MPRLVSVLWSGNNGVMVRYSGGKPHRWVPPDGSLRVGEVAKLLNIYPVQVYRLHDRGIFRFVIRGGAATVKLSDIRRYQRNGHQTDS